MRIVLLDDIAGLGEAGSVVNVKNGYARNFLLPRRLAERATADAINRVVLIQRAAEVKRARRKSEAAEKFARLQGQSITITVKAGTAGRIFGSITTSAIVEEVKKQLGHELDRRHVQLEEPIKHLGEFEVPLRAAADVTGSIKVIVEPEGPRGQRGRGPGSAGSRRGATPEPEPQAAQPAAEAETGEAAEGNAEESEGAGSEAVAISSGSAEAAEERYEDIESGVEG